MLRLEDGKVSVSLNLSRMEIKIKKEKQKAFSAILHSLIKKVPSGSAKWRPVSLVLHEIYTRSKRA